MFTFGLFIAMMLGLEEVPYWILALAMVLDAALLVTGVIKI